MKKLLYISALSLTTAVLTVGCSSKSEFYQLRAETESRPTHVKKNTRHRIIGIAEVETSDYLQKPEIVTRYSKNHLNVHEEERWAGSLDKNIQSVLKENLERLLPKYTFLSYPWEEPLTDKYRIYLYMDRFDGDTEGVATMKGRWSLIRQTDNRVVIMENFTYSEYGGNDTESIIAAQSRLMGKLSRHISARISRQIR